MTARPTRHTTRLEAFTDAAFAFSLTLLVIAGDNVPASYADFLQALKAIPAFVASAALLLMFWYCHMRWSQRYGLTDVKAVIVTSALVCTVLVFVYPLRIVFSSLFHWLSGGYLPMPIAGVNLSALNTLFVIYAFGFIAMCALIALLYQHTLANAEALQLDSIERQRVRFERNSFLLLLLPGLLSLLYLAVVPARWGPLSGFMYSSLAVIMPIHGIYAEKRLKQMAEAQRDEVAG